MAPFTTVIDTFCQSPVTVSSTAEPMNITKTFHLYGAVLLLLAGQVVLGRAERIKTRNINTCVQLTTQSEVIEDNLYLRGFPFNAAVAFCNGGRSN